MILERLARPSAPAPAPESRASIFGSIGRMRSLLGWGGLTTRAGPLVNELSALQLSAVYSCVRIRSETFASLPRHLLERAGREVRKATDHPAYRMLLRAPNPQMTAYNFWQWMAASLDLRGNALAAVERDNLGRARALWPLRWDHVEVKIRAGLVTYEWRGRDWDENQPPRVYVRGASALHLHGLSFDGITGLGPVALHRESIGEGLAQRNYALDFFANSARPDGVLEHPGVLGASVEEREAAAKRLREQWETMHGTAAGAAHRVAVLEEGLKWHAIGVSQKDAEYLAGRKFNRSEIAGLFGVPAHLIGDLDRATFSNIEQQALEFILFHLRPALENADEAIERDVLSAPDREAHYYVKHAVEGLLRGDTAARTAYYNAGVAGGWLLVNEARALEDLPPIEGGDTPRMPQNLALLDALGRPVPMPGGSASSAPTPLPTGTPARAGAAAETRARLTGYELRARLAARAVPVYADLTQRLVRAERREIDKLLAAHFRAAPDVDAFRAALEALHAPDGSLRGLLVARATPVVTSFARQVVEVTASDLDAPIDPDGFEAWLGGLAGAFAARYALASLRSLDAAARAAPEAARAAVEEVLDLWETERAARVARSETVRESRAVARETMRRAGVTLLRWVTRGDACELCATLNGVIVAVEGGSFASAGQTITAAGRPPLTLSSSLGHPPLHRGCDCEIAPG